MKASHTSICRSMLTAFIRLLTAAALSIALVDQVRAAEGHDEKPMHGGVVVVTHHLTLELVAKPNTLRIYVRDHGKAVNLAKSSAKLTILSGQEKQEIELNPATDYLEATGTFKVAASAKAVAVVTLNGRPLTARFVIKSP
jgi:hypothetical protein